MLIELNRRFLRKPVLFRFMETLMNAQITYGIRKR
jgi:hypothetical protein